MLAEAKEMGNRPPLLTPARMNAPAASVQLAKIFEQPGHTWADRADIILDWQNELLESPVEELHYPVMVIVVDKYVPGKGHLVVQSRLNVDNVFTGDVVTREVLEDIVEELKITTLGKLQESGVL